MPDLLLVQGDFYPRPLRGGRPDTVNAAMQPFKFLSTPSARRATKPETDIRIDKLISIHALCEEGDGECYRINKELLDFYPRPLRGGRRSRGQQARGVTKYFYPRPLRGGRRRMGEKSGHSGNFYPRPLRGGRLITLTSRVVSCGFLSTPSARRATDAKFYIEMVFRFLSTPSARRATKTARKTKAINLDFYPRPLRGGRPHTYALKYYLFEFLSTPSARRATRRRQGDDHG